MNATQAKEVKVVAVKKPKRAPSGSFVISRSAFKKLEKAVENPPKANKALKDFVRRGEAILKHG